MDLREILNLLCRFQQVGYTSLPNKVTIKSWSQGIDFLGYVSMPFCTVLRTKTKNRMFKRLNQMSAVPNQTLQSYLGLLKHSHSFKLKKQLKNYPQI